MIQHMILAAAAAIALGSVPVLAQAQDQEPKPPLGFFVTSTMHSGNLGGLAGADAECQRLAAAAGAGEGYQEKPARGVVTLRGGRPRPSCGERWRPFLERRLGASSPTAAW